MIAAVALALAALAGCGGAATKKAAPRPGLRLNQIQMVGTHNSYHVAPPNPGPGAAYSHRPLDEQLQRGVRQLELDVHWDGGQQRFRVFHSIFGDNASTCDAFTQCLMLVRDWSRAHPRHHTVFVFVEPKDQVGQPPIAPHLDALDGEIRSVFDAAHLVTPDDVPRRRWPTVDASRGKVLFVFLAEKDEMRRAYTANDTTLKGRPMFVLASEGPLAAITSVSDPTVDRDRITRLVKAGLIVRTRADVDLARVPRRVTDAIDSGAQIVSTDFPDEVKLAGGTPSRCDPLTAPAWCRPSMIER